MLKTMTIEELKYLYSYYLEQYECANLQGKKILWHYIRRLRRRIRRLTKKSTQRVVEIAK